MAVTEPYVETDENASLLPSHLFALIKIRLRGETDDIGRLKEKVEELGGLFGIRARIRFKKVLDTDDQLIEGEEVIEGTIVSLDRKTYSISGSVDEPYDVLGMLFNDQGYHHGITKIIFRVPDMNSLALSRNGNYEDVWRSEPK